MKTLRLLLILMLTTLSVSLYASQTRKVLIIGIDGCRSDALQQAHTPNIDSLIAHGLYSWDVYHLGITISGPSWSDIMTGVWENKHGVQNNQYNNSHYNDYPYFLTHAKEVRPNLYGVQVTEWAPMSDQVYNDGWDQKLKVPDGLGTPTVAAAFTQLSNPNLDAMFVYFDKVDLTGHASGFSPQNSAYITAIEFVDSCVGLVVDSLHRRANYANEDWMILVITDHGGIGTGHGGNTDEERHIWWIGSGNRVAHQQISAPDPGSYYMPGGVDSTILAVTPVQTDIAVTALDHLLYGTGIDVKQAAWDLDGKSWRTTMIPNDTLTEITGINNAAEEETQVSMYPNPTTGLFTLWFNNPRGGEVYYTVTDLAGHQVKQGNELSSKNKVNVDLADQSNGVYFITLHVGESAITKKVMLTH